MLKKLKSLFIVEDEASKKQVQKGTDTKATSPKPSGQAPKAPLVDSKPDPSKGKPEEKFINRLLGAIEANNIKGFDYLEYKQSLQNLGGVEMNEETKYQSALAMAKTMGATKEILLSSAKHYIKILTEEEQKFLVAFKNQQVKQVDNRNAEIKKLTDTIKSKEAKIEQLKKELEADRQNLESRKKSINQANAKVEATRDNFYHSYNIVKSQIEEDLKKIEQFLK